MYIYISSKTNHEFFDHSTQLLRISSNMYDDFGSHIFILLTDRWMSFGGIDGSEMMMKMVELRCLLNSCTIKKKLGLE